ncbi:hypothetical protein KIPB_012306, partial [Kipferlia bialata]|eukprot:g12306.t1
MEESKSTDTPSANSAGTCMHQLPESGFGTYTFPDGDVYEGEWEGSKPNGSGIYTSLSGVVYKGRFIDGNLNGHATVQWGDGGVYVGEVENFRTCGYGTLTMPDGNVYEGNVTHGVLNGHGRVRTPDGTMIEGEFKDGKPCGRMVATGATGIVSELHYGGEGMSLTSMKTSSGREVLGDEVLFRQTVHSHWPKPLSDSILTEIVERQLGLPVVAKLGDIRGQFGIVTTAPLSTRVLYMPDTGSLRLDQFCEALGSTTLS